MSSYPGLRLVDYQNLSDGDWNPAAISDEYNAMGSTPPRILYLWIFNRPNSLCGQLITHGWAFIGPIHLLVSPAARVATPIMKSREDIDRAVQDFRYGVERNKCPKLIDYEYRAHYHGYPINYLWCSNRMWEYGFEAMAQTSDYFVMDLSASERPDGLVTEIRYLLHHVPLGKVIFLLDVCSSDAEIVDAFMGNAWGGMQSTSANINHGTPLTLICYDSGSMGYMAQATLGLWAGKGTVPLARRATHFAHW